MMMMKKKSLIALAVLAAAGAASAQSSVTLYGRVEANVTYQQSGDAAAEKGESVVKMNDGVTNGVGGSRWGLRGSEDLGNGLKAYFVLEQGYNVDTGAAASSTVLFNRQAYVALGSSWGDLRLGRVETLTRELNVSFGDVTGEAEIAIVDAAFAANRPLFQNLGTRVNNAVEYRSPLFSGFQVIGLVAAGEGAPTARHQGLSATYKAGALAIGAAYEGYDNGNDSYNDVLTIGGNYNFGFATLYGAYQTTSDFGTQTAFTPGTDIDSYSLGVMVPIGDLQLRAQYVAATIDLPNGSEVDNNKVGVSARYPLSKRTLAYAGYTHRGGDVAETLSRKNEFFVGVGHAF